MGGGDRRGIEVFDWRLVCCEPLWCKWYAAGAETGALVDGSDTGGDDHYDEYFCVKCRPIASCES